MQAHKEETSKELDGLLIIVMYLIAYLVSVRSSSIDNTTYLFIGYQYFILQLQRNKKG